MNSNSNDYNKKKAKPKMAQFYRSAAQRSPRNSINPNFVQMDDNYLLNG